MCAKELIIPSDTPDPYDILSHLDSEEFWDSLLTWHRNDKVSLFSFVYKSTILYSFVIKTKNKKQKW